MKQVVLLAVIGVAMTSSSPAQAPASPSGSSVHARGVILLRPEAAPPAVAPAQTPNDASRPVPKPPVLPVIKECPRPFAKPDITLDGPGGFTAALAAKLRGGRRVVVDLAKPFPSDGPVPPALAPWLAEVKSSGGTVTVASYCQQTRGAFGDFIRRLLGIGPVDPGRPYRAARAYNVVLHSNALDQAITQIEFSPRGATGGG